MFDQLFKRASTRARHETAPFAEERARYLDYCELRGDSRSQQLRKAYDLLWIARKLDSTRDLQVTSDQIRALVVNWRSMMRTLAAQISTCSRHASDSGTRLCMAPVSRLSSRTKCADSVQIAIG